MTYVIRKIDDPVEEEEEIHGLHDAIFASDAPLPTIGDAAWWYALDQNAPVGFAAIRPCQNSTNVGLAYLYRCGVLPWHRGHGLQRRLLQVRERWARANGYHSIVTDCTIDNPASANSLIRAGYRLYNPGDRWALSSSAYWIKHLA